MKTVTIFTLLALILSGALLFAQDVGEIMWEDNFDDDDPPARYEVGWFYYDEADGLLDAVVEQRDGALFFQQGSFQVLGVTLAGTNGVPALEADENGDLTEETKEALLANDFSSANQEGTFQVNFKSITGSWFVAPTRMIQDDDLTDSDPRESPAYLVYISPLEGTINLAKVPAVEFALLNPEAYEWLAAGAQYPFELDVFYWIKYYLFDGIYKVKVWEGDASDEPDEWLIETVDPEPRITGNFTYFALMNPDPAGTDVMLIDNVTVREVKGGNVGVAERIDVPSSFRFEQNYPNPFNPSTEIKYALDKAAAIKLTIYNQAGQMVQQLVNAQHPAGVYSVIWSGANMAGVAQPSGIYYAQLTGDGVSKTIKMVLMK